MRLTTAGSTSTWPKSGFTVASIVMLLVKPHFSVEAGAGATGAAVVERVAGLAPSR